MKEALKGTNIDDIKAKQEELQKAFYAISEKMYQQAAAQQQAAQGQADPNNMGGNPGGQNNNNNNGGDDGYVDADFTEVK